MTALTQPCYTLEAAPVEEPSEALLPASETSGMVMSGTATDAVDPVIRTLGDVIIIILQWVSVKRTAAAILDIVITCHSGVTGGLVTDL